MTLRALLVLVSALVLSACGSGQNSAFSAIGQQIASSVGQGQGREGQAGAQQAQTVDAQTTRAALDQRKTPLLLAELPSREARATLIQAGQNRAHVTWMTADGIALILKNGFLTGTRGLGGDLMTTDLAGAEAAIRRGSGSATRTHRYLGGENQIVPITFTCSYSSTGPVRLEIVGRSFTTRKVTESCAAGSRSFENTYWLGVSDGLLWRSTQWIGPALGPITLTHLVR